jgi:hypothetical protein
MKFAFAVAGFQLLALSVMSMSDQQPLDSSVSKADGQTLQASPFLSLEASAGLRSMVLQHLANVTASLTQEYLRDLVIGDVLRTVGVSNAQIRVERSLKLPMGFRTISPGSNQRPSRAAVSLQMASNRPVNMLLSRSKFRAQHRRLNCSHLAGPHAPFQALRQDVLQHAIATTTLLQSVV